MLSMLKEFIINHPVDWRERLSQNPFFLNVIKFPEYTIVNYKTDSSKQCYYPEIITEAYGVIVDNNTNKVVSRSFGKVFTFNDKFSNEINWDSARIKDIFGDQIVSIWFNNGKWKISTNNNPDAFTVPISSDSSITYGELFQCGIRFCGYKNLEEFFAKLNRNHCYSISIFNEHPVKLFLVSEIDIEENKEITPDKSLVIPEPREFKISDFLNGIPLEYKSNKICIVDDNFNRALISRKEIEKLKETRNKQCL